MTDATNSLTGVTGNLNTFLKILTTQLKNQDPTAAQDTNQFTQELVQFASAEQQINTNSKLDKLITLQKTANGATTSIGYLGKYIEAASDGQLPLQSGAAEMTYNLDGPSTGVTIAIKNAAGATVRTLNGEAGVGTHYVSWDGKDSGGNQLTDGAYTFTITAAKTLAGKDVTVANKGVIALVTSVSTNDDGTASLGLGNAMAVDSSLVGNVYAPGSQPGATTGSGS